MIRTLIGALLALAVVGHKVEPLERVGRLAAPAIVEASGLVASRRHPGIFWVHNDSQNPPELFAVRRDGQLVRAYRVAVPNIDWEDIATDDSGHLYLADTGNNKLLLPIRAIHRLAEPDPTAATEPAGPLAVEASYYYKFAADRRFDAEGMVVHANQALLVTKHRDGKVAELYRLSLREPVSFLHPLTPALVGNLAGCVEPATGATLTRDGRTLAVVTDRAVRVYESPDQATWTAVGSAMFREPDVEAITWDGADLILASEDRSIYRVPPARWRPGKRGGAMNGAGRGDRRRRGRRAVGRLCPGRGRGPGDGPRSAGARPGGVVGRARG